jgi:hypothetical protein
MQAPVKSIVLLMPVLFEYIDQFNLSTAKEFVTYVRAVNAIDALPAQYHSNSSMSSRDRTAVVIVNGLSLSQ